MPTFNFSATSRALFVIRKLASLEISPFLSLFLPLAPWLPIIFNQTKSSGKKHRHLVGPFRAMYKGLRFKGLTFCAVRL